MTIEQFYDISGGDLNGVLQRIPMKSFLTKVLKKFVDDPGKTMLDKAIEAQNQSEAFSAVHTLKGVTLNLGLSNLAEPCKTLTEALRQGSFGDGWENAYKSICEEYDKVISYIKQLDD